MAIKKKIIDVASDVLSAPARAYYGVKSMRANSDADAIQRARKYDGAPDYNNDGSVTDAFKARSAADAARERTIKRNYTKGFGKP